MKLGVRAHDYGKHSPEKLAEILHREGLTSAQLAIPLAIEGINSFADITDELLLEIKTAFQKYGIEISVLSCYIDPAHEDDEFRKGQVETFQFMLECSKKLGAKMVGTETSMYNGTEADRTIQFERLVESVSAMVQKAEELDAYVGIEAVTCHTMNSVDRTAELIERINSKHLKVILDPLNLIDVSNMTEQSKIYNEAIHRYGDRIEAIHLKDGVYSEQGYTPKQLGTGIMEFTELFEWLKKEKPEICILREEMMLENAMEDIKFMKTLIQ